MRFATVRAEGRQLYGAVVEGGFVALSGDFPQWPSLREVIAADGLGALEAAAEGRGVTHPEGRFDWDLPIPAPEKIICVGVNFPDRNAEYKDGQEAPPNMSLFIRFARSFTGHGQALIRPPETPQLAALLLERGAQADAVALGDPRGTPLCWALSSWFTHAGGVQTGLTDAYLDGGARIEGLSGDGAPLGHAIGFGYTASVEHLARRGARADHLTGAAALGDVAQLRAWMRTDGSFSPQALTFTMGTRRETGRFSWPPPLDPDPAALALVTGATHGRLAVVRMLVEHGIEPDRAVSMDQTALHFAAYMGHRAVVEYLLTVGARTDMRERQFGLTAADWARETGEDDLAQRIEEHGETSR